VRSWHIERSKFTCNTVGHTDSFVSSLLAGGGFSSQAGASYTHAISTGETPQHILTPHKKHTVPLSLAFAFPEAIFRLLSRKMRCLFRTRKQRPAEEPFNNQREPFHSTTNENRSPRSTVRRRRTHTHSGCYRLLRIRLPHARPHPRHTHTHSRCSLLLRITSHSPTARTHTPAHPHTPHTHKHTRTHAHIM